MSGVLNMNGNKINNVGTPDTNENDAAVNVDFFQHRTECIKFKPYKCL